MVPTARKRVETTDLTSMSFVERVYTMLEEASSKGFEDIVRWEEDGQSFKVYKGKEFEEFIQPVYLNQSKVRSFQRKVRHEYIRGNIRGRLCKRKTSSVR